jgi:hypothetical protein
MKPLKKNATYDDVLAVPDHFVAEMFDGDLYVFSRPALPHARAASVLGAILTVPFDQGRNGPGGWVILDEPELHFGNDVLVPDIAAWRREQPTRADGGSVSHARAGLGVRGTFQIHRADGSWCEAADLRA